MVLVFPIKQRKEQKVKCKSVGFATFHQCAYLRQELLVKQNLTMALPVRVLLPKNI